MLVFVGLGVGFFAGFFVVVCLGFFFLVFLL